MIRISILALTVAGLAATPVAAQQQAQPEQAQQAQGAQQEQQRITEAEAADIMPGPQGLSWQAAQPEGTLPQDPQIALVKVADGLTDPVAVVSAPGDAERLFVVERIGLVRIIQDGQVLEEPFLDIREDTLAAFLEQGLYDIEFDPDFQQNGFVYVHFAEMLRNGDSVIVRYTVSQDNPNQIDPESARMIMQIDQPWANHNGGELAFGPDGYLYIGSGDGGWEGDPLEAGQDLSTLLGKLLRIDVRTGDAGRPYTIPDDNPFAGQAGLVRLFGIGEEEFAAIHTEARPEIWSYGLRNPWKFSFDPETGLLYMPDVGQNHWEEINVTSLEEAKGANFGWDFLMGTKCFPVQEEDCARIGLPPVAEYEHELGCAVIDIGVYRGEDIPGLDGVYLAGDYCTGRIFGLARAEGPAGQAQTQQPADQAQAGQAQVAEGAGNGWQFATVLDTGLRVTGSGRGPDGGLYVTSCNCDYGQEPGQEGAVWRVAPAGAVQQAETAPVDE